MKPSMEEMRVLAGRMRLALSDEELEAYACDLDELEELAEALLPYGESRGEERTVCFLSQMREDEVLQSLPREKVLQNASKHNGAALYVPRVVGEGDL